MCGGEVLASVEARSSFADQTRTATCKRRWRRGLIRPSALSHTVQGLSLGPELTCSVAPRTTPGAFRLSEAGTRIGRRERAELRGL